nr:reverse transcriptase domain-containing protein [Tanacetum cinerariifolium]
PLIANSFVVSGMVNAEPGVGATTRSAAHIGSSFLCSNGTLLFRRWSLRFRARIDAMTMKMDAQYKEFQSRSKQPNLNHNDDDKPMSPEEEAEFMQTFRRIRFYNDYHDRDLNRNDWHSSRRNDYNRDNYRSNSDDKPELQKQLSNFIKAQHSTNSFVKDTFMDLKTKLETTTKNHQASIQNLEAKFDRLAENNLVDLLDLFQVTLNITKKVAHPYLINFRKLETSM